jgi:hypothetical protein
MTDSKEIAEIDYSEFANDGNESLTSDDFQIPYIKILEKLSPTLDEIDNAKAGEIFLSSRDLSLEDMNFIPLHYMTVFSVWSEDQGDKLLGTFKTNDDAKAYIESSGEKATIVETGQNILLLLDEENNIDHPVMLYLSKSRLQVNKALNTKIQMIHPKNAPRYAGIWNLATKSRTNTKGTWYLPKFSFYALCDKKLLESARNIYKDITKNIEENTFRVY